MRILHDSLRFIAIGAIQIALDSSLYIALTNAGAPPPVANICGRIAGASLGFWLNGRITFGHHVQPQLPVRFARYAVLWLSLTAVSTFALTEIARNAGLASSWWAKPLVEVVLGLTSFLVSRHWVYWKGE